MAILLIKIGCNVPDTYKEIDKMYRHGDIVDVLPRQFINGVWTEDYSPGIRAEKEFLCIKMDTSHMTDSQFSDFRDSLRQSHVEDTGAVDANGTPIFKMKKRRKYAIDFTKADFLSAKEKSDITKVKDDYEKDKKEIDVSKKHKISSHVAKSNIDKCVYDKISNLTIDVNPLVAAFNVPGKVI